MTLPTMDCSKWGQATGDLREEHAHAQRLTAATALAK
jgi:hypothetical protein